MYFKLSNTAAKETLEKMTKAYFKYPNLYRPQNIIHGLTEATLPIITMEEPDQLSLAIWGLLPESHTDDWSVFQNNFNTLNFHEESMDSKLWYAETMKERRCLIPVTGYFTTLVENGESYFFKIELKSGEPFYLAGVYNILEDGFITCSILIGRTDDFIKQVQNTVDTMPITISNEERDEWLSQETSPMRIKQLLKRPVKQDFKATSISNELYNFDDINNNLFASFEVPSKELG